MSHLFWSNCDGLALNKKRKREDLQLLCVHDVCKRLPLFAPPIMRPIQYHIMAGLRKQEEYNWKDSNLALFGSDTEKKVKLESAQSEPAWTNSGK